MTTACHRRHHLRAVGLLTWLVLVAGLAPAILSTPPLRATGVAGVLAADGTPATGQPVVITAAATPPRTVTSGRPLRLAGPIDDPTSLDPALARDLSTAFLCRQLFRGLTRFDDDLDVVPELAERIEISADGLVYTFRLRPTATFQNGRPITADDVVFSLTRALNPATTGGSPGLLAGPTYLSDIAGAADLIAGRTDRLNGARVLDDHTVELRLTSPRATFLAKLAAAAAGVVDKDDVARGGDWWRTPNGSGPFRLRDWQPRQMLTFTPFDGYFAGPPASDRIQIRLGPAASQPFNLYQAGQIDVAGVPPSAVERVLDPDGALRDQLVETPLFAVGYAAFRTDEPPLDDPHVRRAIQLAFPRHKLTEVGFEGHKLPADGLIPPGMLDRDWPVAAEPYDLDAAKRELAASRYGGAEAVPPIRIYGSSTYGSEALRDVLEADLGLRIDVVEVEWPEFNDGLANRAYPAYELLWGADYPDPESFLWSLFASDGSDNYVGYANPDFDALLRQAAATLDPDQRADLYAAAQQRLIDDDVIVPFYFDVGYTLVRPDVRDLVITPLGILYLDRVWLER